MIYSIIEVVELEVEIATKSDYTHDKWKLL